MQTINLELTLEEIKSLEMLIKHMNGYDIRAYIARDYEGKADSELLDIKVERINRIYYKLYGSKLKANTKGEKIKL